MIINGWDPAWYETYFTPGAIAPPLVTLPYLSGSLSHNAVSADARPSDGDPHLRSAAAVTGYNVHAIDGEIGHIEDFLIDDATWRVRYLEVDTKNWWPGNIVLISPSSVQKIDWASKLVHLSVDRQKVKNSPAYNPSTAVDGAYDETFLTYYGIKWVRP